MSNPTPQPNPEAQPADPTPARPSSALAIALPFLPFALSLVFGALHKSTSPGDGGIRDFLEFAIVVNMLLAPLVVGILSARRFGQCFQLGIGAQFLTGIGVILFSYLATIPGCAMAL